MQPPRDENHKTTGEEQSFKFLRYDMNINNFLLHFVEYSILMNPLVDLINILCTKLLNKDKYSTYCRREEYVIRYLVTFGVG